eukprot:jgi/Botrbrau1/12496/Bobra.0169s0043.1
MLRFLAALTTTNVVLPNSFIDLLQGIADRCLALAKADGAREDEGRRWQPYADHLIHMALMALPWGSSMLPNEAGPLLDTFFESVVQYMDLRPRTVQPVLRPFFEDVRGGTPGQSDSGGASFLTQVWEAVDDMRAVGKWHMSSIPDFSRDFEAVLAKGTAHEVDLISVPETPPCIASMTIPCRVHMNLGHICALKPTELEQKGFIVIYPM